MRLRRDKDKETYEGRMQFWQVESGDKTVILTNPENQLGYKPPSGTWKVLNGPFPLQEKLKSSVMKRVVRVSNRLSSLRSSLPNSLLNNRRRSSLPSNPLNSQHNSPVSNLLNSLLNNRHSSQLNLLSSAANCWCPARSRRTGATANLGCWPPTRPGSTRTVM